MQFTNNQFTGGRPVITPKGASAMRIRRKALRALKFAELYARASVGAAYAITVGITQRRHRGLLADIARHFGFDYHGGVRPEAPKLSVSDVVADAPALSLRDIDAVSGNVSLLELTILASVAATIDAGSIFEIGTFNGRTTVNLAANAPRATVYTLDLPVGEATNTSLRAEQWDRAFMPNGQSLSRIEASENARRIVQLRGDSATFDFAPFAGTVDLCFVDGAHSYEYVINDSLRALEMVRHGGVILWHDYSVWPGVTRALNELFHSDRRFAALQWIAGTSLARLLVSEPQRDR